MSYTKKISNFQVEVLGSLGDKYDTILTEEALLFVAKLHKNFNERRKELLAKREERQKDFDKGILPDFLPETKHIRESDWQVAAIPASFQDRRVEITGPVDRKMVINALNSGAKVFMADFEDSNSPTWVNTIEGQINLFDALRRQIDFTLPNGKSYQLNEKTATLTVRPRGWHLFEKNIKVDGEIISGSLLDFGLFFFHNAAYLQERGLGPFYYLPKLESHLEARLWNDVFVFAQNELNIPQNTIKVTVLIETILAAFEMEEIIYELRNHMAGLNAGRWDYIFSVIKKFRNNSNLVLPDRGQITMAAPFMQAYARLLAKTCHKRGAHAIGGMSAFIPSRKDEEINKNAFAKVRADKENEAANGFDGTWVAHPDLVKVAMDIFDATLGSNPHQKNVIKDYTITANDLLNFNISGGKITEEGFRMNINVGILYVESWINGVGAAAIHNLMEDAATAEISRAQLWQWIHNNVTFADGKAITIDLYHDLKKEELVKIKEMLGEERYNAGKFELATELFDYFVESKNFEEFLTLKAYQYI